MKPPAFWDADPPPWQARLIAPAGHLYGAVTALRMRMPGGYRSGVPVVCVGNFTLGGTGKTPTVIALAARLRARGERPFVLTRGYGGRVAGPHRVDARRDLASDVGDEPLLIARAADVVVGRDRAEAARHAERLGATFLVMDDGLQNPDLVKDVTIAVVDGGAGYGNRLPFPAGPLRAPVALQRGRVDALLVVGPGPRGDAILASERAAGRSALTARLVPDRAAAALAGQRVLAFCGIGRPDKFRETLADLGISVEAFRGFPDHHVYTRADAERLITEAAGAGLALVTTEKDQVRIAGDRATQGLLAGIVNVVGVTLEPDDAAGFEALIDRAVQRARVSR